MSDLTLCGECEFKKFKHYISVPHISRWYWWCEELSVELINHSGVRRNSHCPKIEIDGIIPRLKQGKRSQECELW